MGNRSDRRLANLDEPSGPRGHSTDQDEARRFHHGPEQITELLAEAVYTNATGFTLVDRRLATGAGSIYEGSSPPLRQGVCHFHRFSGRGSLLDVRGQIDIAIEDHE